MNHFLMLPKQPQLPQRLFQSLLWPTLLAISCFVGCDQPIYDNVVLQPDKVTLDLSADVDPDRHNWTLNGNSLSVAKPLSVAYLTSFPTKISIPQRPPADTSLWTATDHSDAFNRILKVYFKPFDDAWVSDGEIPSSDFAGPQAFDIAADGARVVTVSTNELALYRAPSGTLVGKIKLPAAWSGGAPTAVRFAPQSNDFLIASQKTIGRISSKDGSLLGQVDWEGEAIRKWLVAGDDSFMVILTESGKLFGGLPNLSQLERLKLGITNADETFADVGLSFDGMRLLVMAGSEPRTYLQQDGRIVDYVDHHQHPLDGPVAISSGRRDDVWVSPKRFFTARANQGPNSAATLGSEQEASINDKLRAAAKRDRLSTQMLWQTEWIQSVRFGHDIPGEWVIALSRRLAGGQPQWVLHDLNGISRLNSAPLALPDKPLRVAANRYANVVAVMDAQALRLAEWVEWKSRQWNTCGWQAMEFFQEASFEEFEGLLDVLHSGKYHIAQGWLPDFEYTITNRLASDLADLRLKRKKNSLTDAERNLLEKSDAWFERESFWSRNIHASVLYCEGQTAHWNGDGLPGDPQQRYAQLRDQCLAEMKRLLETDRPAVITITHYISQYLEATGDFEHIDPICRRALELYPDSIHIPFAVAWKLQTRWYGEWGDAISFVRLHSRLFEPPFDSLMYASLIASFGNKADYRESNWRSLNQQLLEKGVDAYVSQGERLGGRTWSLFSTFGMLRRINPMEKQLLDHVLETDAVAPANDKITGQVMIHDYITRLQQRLQDAVAKH